MSKFITVLLVGMLLSVPSLAKESLDVSSIAGVGARPLALGKAYVAIADDANVIFGNAAGLSGLKGYSLTSMSTKLIDKVDYKLIGAVVPSVIGNIGLGYTIASSPAGYNTTDENSLASAKPISYQTSKLTVSYGKSLPLNGLSAGVDVNLHSNGLTGYNGSSSGYSVGGSLLYRPNTWLSLGSKIENITSELKSGLNTTETLRQRIKIGGAAKVLGERVLIATDADVVKDEPVCLHTGLEVKPLDMIAIRAGYDEYAISADAKLGALTAGVGLEILGISLDYAYQADNANYAVDTASHYFSISFTENVAKNVEFASIN